MATIQIIPWTIIEVKPGAFGQILHSPGDHKWAPEQKYLPSDQDWIGLRKVYYSSRTRLKAGGQKCGHCSSDPGPLLLVVRLELRFF